VKLVRLQIKGDDGEPKTIAQSSEVERLERAGLLSDSDLAIVKNLQTELQDTFEKTQVFRTRTEMEVSVLNRLKFPTPAARYWQAVREQNNMLVELIMLSFEFRKNGLEIAALELGIENLMSCGAELDQEAEIECDLMRVELDKRRFITRQQERVARARVRELVQWSEIKDREAKQMTEMELLDVDNPQLLYYTKRFIGQSIAVGENGSPAERQNLLGQLRTAILLCIERGLLDTALEGFPLDIVNTIKSEYGIKG